MNIEEFRKEIYHNAEEDYGLCPPPISAQKGLDILIEHFLGDDWYTPLSLPTEQCNTEAIGAILSMYPKKFNWFKRLISKLCKLVT